MYTRKMNSSDRFFMASVDLLNAERAVDQARDHLENNTPYMAIIDVRIALEKLANAMERIFKEGIK